MKMLMKLGLWSVPAASKTNAKKIIQPEYLTVLERAHRTLVTYA